jgi:septal ring factor EnvC (AmiA/AmiB activator)
VYYHKYKARAKETDMSDHFNSEIEKTNLEVHVDMSRQRYALLSNNVEGVAARMGTLTNEFSEFRNENAKNIADLKESQLSAINKLREEQAQDNQGTIKVVVGAAGTVIAGLLGVIVTLLITFL